MSIINAINSDTELGKAFETYSKHMGPMNELKNQISVLKAKLEKLQEDEEYINAKAEIDLRTRMNNGSLVCGSWKCKLVKQPERVQKAYDYVLITRGK